MVLLEKYIFKLKVKNNTLPKFEIGTLNNKYIKLILQEKYTS